MKDQVSSATTKNTFQVPPDATIRNAAALTDGLREAIRETPALILDLSRVESVDLSFFQILLAGQRMAGAMQKTLTLNPQSVSEVVREAAALCGYSAHLKGSLADEDACLWKEEG
ncbi:MAG: STAS domain-containing protein [Desulfuromonadales bacterium]